ncbi:MAG: DUF4375 domain-containing protein [Capsulimonas sp.]|uniref:DMP19 family protein n=1 Tax=Capsulimonas sp. TaxID=2494211 RepID=UPI003267E3DC
MSDHKFRPLPIPPRSPFFSWLLRISSVGLALFCYQAYRHNFQINPQKPVGHLLTQALFLAAPILWAFALVRLPQTTVDGEMILCQNPPSELATRNWWSILLYLTPAITGVILLAEQLAQNPVAMTLAHMTLGSALLTAAALFAAALCVACIRLTRGTLSRLSDGLRLGSSLFLPWETIGSVVQSGEFYGFCAPGMDGVTGSYVRVKDPEARQWLDGALTEVGARVRSQPTPLDYALQLACIVISGGAVALGVWLHGAHGVSWQWVLLIETAAALAGISGIEMLRGFARVERLKPELSRQTPISAPQAPVKFDDHLNWCVTTEEGETVTRRVTFGQGPDGDAADDWNAMVDLGYTLPRERQTDAQRIAGDVLKYEGEVMNGGHMQYFENRGVDAAEATIRALETLGAQDHLATLTAALAAWRGQTRKPIRSAQEYSARAMEGEFDALDKQYYATNPDLNTYLRKYLAEHRNEFIVDRPFDR